MPANDFLTFSAAGGANCITQAAWAALGLRPTGFIPGLADETQANKVWRQSSIWSRILGQIINDRVGLDALDNGDAGLATLEANLIAAIADIASVSGKTGDLRITLRTAADPGWIAMNDGTIGSATSGATTYANALALPLFTLLWQNISNTYAPVSGGRGASAAADFAANKTLTLIAVVGRALAIAGAGAGLTTRLLGQSFGEENHILILTELAAHNHAVTITDNGHTHGVSQYRTTDTTTDGGGVAHGVISSSALTTVTSDPSFSNLSASSSNNGSGSGHNTMQPTAFVNLMIHL